MLSYSEQQTLSQNLVQDASSSALTFLKQQINIGKNILEVELNAYSEELEQTDLTEAGVASYPNPYNYLRFKSLYITVGGRQYNATPVYDERTWRTIQADTQNNESDFVTHVFPRRNTFELFPTPSSAGNVITTRYQPLFKDLAADDYTTGTITTLANGGTAVTGSGTTFTANMVNRFFKVNDDGQWYEISGFSSTTAITLARQYAGTAISGGSENFTIGEMMRTPGPTHHIPAWYAAWQYFEGFKFSEAKAKNRKRQYEEYIKWAKKTFQKRYSTRYHPPKNVIASDIAMVNPNWYPESMT